MNQLLLMFLAAFAVSVICTPLAIKLAPKIGAVDVPKDARRMHTKPMAIFLGTMGVIMVFLEKDSQLWGVILSGTLMYLVGVVDDLKGISAKVKLLGQIACAAILYCFSIRITTMANLLPW